MNYRSGECESHCVFHLIKKMSIEKSDVRNVIAEVLIEATSWRLRECIQVRELAATHRLGQMRRLQMLEEQKAWKQEAGFDRIDTAAEMDAQRFRTSLVSEPFYNKLFNPRWPHTPAEFTLEMKFDVERPGKLPFHSLRRRRNVIHRRDGYPRSIRGQRNPERRDGCPRSVRGQMNSSIVS